MTTQSNHLQSSIRPYTLGEEIVHSVTHGIGAGLSISGLTILVMLAVLYGTIYQTVGFTIYGASLIILYLASTLYHSFQQPQVKQIFKIMDHSAIYVLIAGSYTPFLLLTIPGTLGWTLLVIIWALAITGVSFKTVFIHRFDKLSVLTYILMGWLSLVAVQELWVNLPLGGFIWLAAGGVVYTVGVIFYLLHQIPYTHAVWHIFVMAGSLCHYMAVLLYLTPTL